MFAHILLHAQVHLDVCLQRGGGTEMLAADVANSPLFPVHFRLVLVVLVGVEELLTASFTLHGFLAAMSTVGVHGESNSTGTPLAADSAKHDVLFVLLLDVGLQACFALFRLSTLKASQSFQSFVSNTQLFHAADIFPPRFAGNVITALFNLASPQPRRERTFTHQMIASLCQVVRNRISATTAPSWVTSAVTLKSLFVSFDSIFCFTLNKINF